MLDNPALAPPLMCDKRIHFKVNRLEHIHMVMDYGKFFRHTRSLTVGNVLNTISLQRRVTEEEVMSIPELADTPQLEDDHRMAMMQAIDQKMQGGGMQVQGKQFCDYYNNDLRTLFESDAAQPIVKTRLAALHLCKLKGTELNEKSWAHVSAVTHNAIMS